MSLYQISIFNDKNHKINPVFVRANGKLLNRYSERFADRVDLLEKISLLEALWKKEYNAELIKTSETVNSRWTTINFSSQKDMTLFLLKMG